MERIGIEQAAVEISGNCRGKTPPNTPYFFIVGAGLSASVVPQASRVIEMLQERAAASNRQIAPPPSEDTMAVYGHWFRSVLNSRGKQREFLEELMRNVEISAENLRLALLLLDSKIGNIVVTPNFDDFLSRALTLFGNRHVISDNPYTSVRIRTESPEIQIVHVHGTYWFYDAANLQQDIKLRARSGKNGVTTTSDLLNHILRTHSPIVIGYSGWEQDVIMRALAIRLGQHRQFPLEYPLYWCCYNEKDVEQLPACIREHPNDDVRVVVPQSMLGTSKAKQTRKQEVSSSNVAAISSALRGLPGGGDVLSGGPAVYSTQPIAGAKLGDDAVPPMLLTADLAVEPLQRTLPARDVLSRLMLHTEVRAPQLLTDPAAYLSSHLRQSFPISSSPNEIIWQLTVQRLERSRPVTGAGFTDQLGELIFATLVSDFAAAIKRGAQLDWSEASSEQLESYAHLMQECASGIYQHQPTESEDAIAQNSDDLARIGYEVVTKVYSALEKTSALDEGQAGRYLRSLLRHARVCDRLQRQDEALASNRKLIERFYDDSKDEASLFSVCLSLLYVSADLFKKQSWDEALETLNKLAAKQVDTNDADLTVLFARASGLRGMLHLQRGDLTASQTCFEKLISDFGTNSSPQIQAVVAQSMTGRAQALAQGGMSDEALKLYKEVIQGYAHSQDSETINNVALAYAGAVNILAVSHEAEAIALAEQAERLVPKGIPGTAPHPSLQLLKFNLATGFLQKGKLEQAMALAEKALESGPPAEADQRMQYDLMRLTKALVLVQSGRLADGLPLIDVVIQENDKATPLNELVRSVALLEKANFFIRQQDQPAALLLFQELGTRYRTSTFGQVRQLAGRARGQRAHMLLAKPETREEAINELKAIQSDESLLSNEQARGSAAAAAIDLGGIAQAEGRIEDAIDIFEQFAVRGAKWTDLVSRLNVVIAHWNAGFLLTGRDEFQRAKPHFEEVVKCAAAFRHPSTDIYHALSLRFLGLICATSDDMAGASEFLRQAEARAQDLPEPQRGDIIVSILLAKGVGFNVAGHAPEAIDSLSVTLADSELIKREGASADIEIAFNMLTSLLVEQKQFDKAVEWTSRGIEWLTGMNRTLTPFHAQLAVRRAQALQLSAKDDDALTAVSQLLQAFHEVHSPEIRNIVDSVFDVLVSKIIELNDGKQVETLTGLFLADFEPAIAPGREWIAAKVAHLSLAAMIDLENLAGAADRLAWMKERLGASEVAGVQGLIEESSQTLEQSTQAPPKSESQSA